MTAQRARFSSTYFAAEACSNLQWGTSPHASQQSRHCSLLLQPDGKPLQPSVWSCCDVLGCIILLTVCTPVRTLDKSAHNGRLTLSFLLHRKHTVLQIPPPLFHRRLKMSPCYPNLTWTTYCVWQNSCWWYMYLPLSTNYEISPRPSYISVARCGVITKMFCL